MPEKSTGQADNPTRRFISEAVAERRVNTPIDVNPAFMSFRAVLLECSEEELVIGFTAGEETTQGNGVVGGGAVAAMLDQSMAIALLARLKPRQTCSTISLNVNILRGALAGSFTARAGLDKIGGRVAFTHARLYDSGGAFVATGSSSLAILEERGMKT